MEQPTLHVTIGAPGSGKSTAADLWRALDPAGRARLSRDGLRDAIGVGGNRDRNSRPVEEMVTMAQHAAVTAWLAAGLDVVVDDTCQSQDTMDAWADLAHRAGARLAVWDYRRVPADVCVARDRQRGLEGGRLVGEDAVRRIVERCAAVTIPFGVPVVRPSGVELWPQVPHDLSRSPEAAT